MFTSNCEVEKRVESRNKKKENETKYADGVMCVCARENAAAALGNEETERKTLQKLQQK